MKEFILAVGCILATIFLTLFFQNNKSKKKLRVFMSQVSGLDMLIIEKVMVSYQTNNNEKRVVIPDRRCNLCLFDNWLAITPVPGQLFSYTFTPIIITIDKKGIKEKFNYLDVYVPDKMTMHKRNAYPRNGETIITNDLDISLTDNLYEHYKIDIRFKGLTEKQTKTLINTGFYKNQ